MQQSGPARTYLEWMRRAAARLGNPYADRASAGSPVAMMRGRIEQAHCDPASAQVSLQLCLSGHYELTGDLGAGRFRARRRPGDLIVGPPFQDISLSGGSRQGMEMLVLAVDWHAVASCIDENGARGLGVFDPVRTGLVRDGRLNTLVTAAWRGSSDPAAPLLGQEIAQAVAAHLLRLAKTPARVLAGRLAPWQYRRVMDAMRDRLSEDLDLNDLAALTGLSPFHFTRAFRATAGRPPHQMLMHLRIMRAETLLATTRLSVLAIALEVGYGSGQALGRAFKRVHGVTPERYRAALEH